MKKATLTLLAALAALTAATAPAMAQPYGAPPGDHRDGPMQPGGWDIDHRIDWTQQRIIHGRDDGSLDRHEFRRVQGQLNNIRMSARRMRWHDGGRLDDRSRDVLNARLDRLNGEIHWLRGNGGPRPW